MKQYTIREISERFSIPASALRYYEELGLLEGVIHNEKKQRVYTEEHVRQLNAICCFKHTGMPLQKIRLFFEYDKKIEENIGDMLSLLQSQREELQEKICLMQAGLAHIRHKEWFYQEIQRAIERKEPWPCWEEYDAEKNGF